MPFIRIDRTVGIGGPCRFGGFSGFVLAWLAIDLLYSQTLGAILGEPLEPTRSPQASTLRL